MVIEAPKETIKGENALYVFNRLLRMAAETELSTWKQNQVRNFLKHDQINDILSLTDGFGRTILDNACAAGNLRLVQHLFPVGAKLGKPHVTMGIVCSEEHLPILDYLLAHDHKLCTTEVVVGDEDDGADRIPLLNFCAKKGDERPLGVLLAYGFKTAESISESLDRLGNTPLHVVRKQKIAAQILNRSGLDILTKRNLRGQLAIDCLVERYAAIKANNGFGTAPGFEEGLKKTIAFLNTLMSHVPRRPTNPTATRTVTPPTLPGMNNLRGSQSMLHRQSSNNSISTSPRLPPRDMKSLLSRDIISKVAAQNRVALLQEQRELLKTEVAALQRHRMLDLQQHEPSIKQQHFLALKKQQEQHHQTTNTFKIMEAASRVASSPSSPSAFRLPLTSPNASSPTMRNRRFVAAIDAAFATERNNTNSVNPSLSLLASLSNHSKSQHSSHNKNLMLHQEDLRMRTVAAKSMFPQARFEENQLHKLLRARYS